jgi:hypothetical protein
MIQGFNFVHINIILYISPKEEFERCQSVPMWPHTLKEELSAVPLVAARGTDRAGMQKFNIKCDAFCVFGDKSFFDKLRLICGHRAQYYTCMLI